MQSSLPFVRESFHPQYTALSAVQLGAAAQLLPITAMGTIGWITRGKYSDIYSTFVNSCINTNALLESGDKSNLEITSGRFELSEHSDTHQFNIIKW